MKKCPFCGADLADDARFCLYCMTSLEDKEIVAAKAKRKKWWLIILATILLFLLIGGGIWFALGQGQTAPTGTGDTQSTVENGVPSGDNNQSDEASTENTTTDDGDLSAANESVSSKNTPSEYQTENSIQTNSNSANNNSTASSIIADADKTTHNTDSSGTTTSDNKTPGTSSTTVSFTPPTEPTEPEVTYAYRKAQKGDDFDLSYPIPEDAIVITDVTTPSKNGEYIIPKKIDGQTVIAIMGYTFCNDNVKNSVKKIVVPATVKTIWNYDFANCYYLTDIYFCGNSIYTDTYAFAEASRRVGTLTIHCSSDCSDRNFRFYKNSVEGYDAQYAEWNCAK